MTQQVNIFLLLFGGLQAALLSILFFRKGRSLPGHWFLAVYLGVMTLQIVLKVMSKVWLMDTLRPLYSFSYQLPFLYGPLIYLFVRQATGRSKTGYSSIFHFIPSILAVFCLANASLHKPLPELLKFLFHARLSMSLQLLSLFCYHALCFQLLDRFRRDTAVALQSVAALRYKWMKQFVVVSFVACSSVAIAICLLYLWFPSYQQLRFAFTILTPFIYWISYRALTQPAVFGVIRGFAFESQERPPVTMLSVHHTPRKYSNSGLRDEDLLLLVVKAEKFMRHEQLYLQPELTIDELATKIPCSRHHLSQALNEKLEKSFYDFINYYRVEKAKTLLTDPGRAGHKVAAIAYDAGFNSISTFNEVFKRQTGVTPSQFRKQPEEKSLRKQRV